MSSFHSSPLSYQELSLNAETLSYQDLLNTKEWRQRRIEILSRDGYKCSGCAICPTESQYNSLTKKTDYFWFGESSIDIRCVFTHLLKRHLHRTSYSQSSSKGIEVGSRAFYITEVGHIVPNIFSAG